MKFQFSILLPLLAAMTFCAAAEVRPFNRLSRTFSGSVEGDGGSIAGNVQGWSYENKPVSFTLTDKRAMPVTTLTPQTAQLGNRNPITPFRYKRSAEINDSFSGIAVGTGEILCTSTRDTPGYRWSVAYLNDGDRLKDKINTCFSSKLYLNETPEEPPWVQIRFRKPCMISRIVMARRIDGGGGFPLDFSIRISRDGTNWQTILKKQGYVPEKLNEFTVSPVEAGYIRVVATKLRKESDKVHYFQLQELEVYDRDGINQALAANGGKASSSGSAANDYFQYDYFFDSIFEAGVKHVLTSLPAWPYYGNFLAGGNRHLPEELIANLKYLNDNGVKVQIRLDPSPLYNGVKKGDIDRAIADWAGYNGWFAAQIKDHASSWVIGNELNFHTAFTPDIILRTIRETIRAIREAGYRGPVAVNSALIDFEWTEKILGAGVGNVIDTFNLHIYKEQPRWIIMPEMAGTFMVNGERHWPSEQPYSDFGEEFSAFRELVKKFNPDINFQVTEASVNACEIQKGASGPFSGTYGVSEQAQAKFLIRLYLYNQMLDLGPTFWWVLEPFILQTPWGLIDELGRRRPAWYGLRNFSSVFDTSLRQLKNPERIVSVEGNAPDLFCAVFEKSTGEWLVPLWCAVPMCDENRGEVIHLTFDGIALKEAEAYDLLSGTKQRLNFSNGSAGAKIGDFIIRDYPVVLKLRRK